MHFGPDARESTNVEDRRHPTTWLGAIGEVLSWPKEAIKDVQGSLPYPKQDPDVCHKLGVCFPENFDPALLNKQAEDYRKAFPSSAESVSLPPLEATSQKN